MVLGITPEAYAVFLCEKINTDLNPIAKAPASIASINDELLVFNSYQAAKEAAELYLSNFPYQQTPTLVIQAPKYVWVAPIMKLWVDGEY